MSAPMVVRGYNQALAAGLDAHMWQHVRDWADLAAEGSERLLSDPWLNRLVELEQEKPSSEFAVSPRLAFAQMIVKMVADGDVATAAKMLLIGAGLSGDWKPAGFGIRIRIEGGTTLYATGFYPSAHPISVRGSLISDTVKWGAA